jgi:MFS family permease
MRTYFTAATLARVGDEMVAFTLVLLVLDRTGNPGLAGITGAAYALPAVFTGPLIGAWLDRTSHRRAALGLNQAVLAVVMVVLVFAVGRAPDWAVPPLAAIAGLTLPMVSGGFSSMLPSLIEAPRLARANSLDAASFGVGTIAGPALAATVAATVSVDAAAAIITVTAVASILVIARLPVLPPAGGTERISVLAGFTHLMRIPPLRASTVASTLAIGVSGILLITLPLHAVELGASEAASGYLWTALEVGCVITALLSGRWLARFRPERVVLISVASTGLAMLTWPLAPSLAVLVVLAVFTGLVEGAMLPAMLTARQVYSPLELQGRVSTTAASLRLGVMAAGQAAGGLLVPLIGTHAALLVVATGLIAASLLALTTHAWSGDASGREDDAVPVPGGVTGRPPAA